MPLELHPENNLSVTNNLSVDGDINTNSRFLSSGEDIGNFFAQLSVNKLDKWLSAGYIFVGDESNIATPTSADGDVSIGQGGLTRIQPNKIFDVHVADYAQISGTKIIPSFGDQTITTNQGIEVQGPMLSSGQDLLSVFITNSLQDGKMWVGNTLNQPQQYTITGDVSVGSGGIASIVPYSIKNIHVANNAGISGIKIIPNFFSTVNVYNHGINVDGGAVIKQDAYVANLNAQGVWVPDKWVWNMGDPYTVPAHWEQGDVIARQDIEAGRNISATGKIVAQGDVQTFGRFMSGNQELVSILQAKAFITRPELGENQVFIGQSGTGAQPKTIFGEVLLSSTGLAVIAPNVITNSHIKPNAAIDGTKIVPSFGNQSILTDQGISVQGPILSGGKELLGLTLDSTNQLYLALSGGTVRGQVTIKDGNLVMGPGTHLLSGGLDLSSILESVITGDYLPIGGGIITGGLIINQDLTVRGDLIVEGSVSQVNTEVHVTSALSVNNNGSGLALDVSQTGNGDVANFHSDEHASILKINQNGFVGIKNGVPECELDVNGTVKFDVLSAEYGYFTQTLTAADIYGTRITAFSGLTSMDGATIQTDLFVGNNLNVQKDATISGDASLGRAIVHGSAVMEKSLVVGITGFSTVPDGSLTVSNYISGGTWLTLGSSASCDNVGSIVAEGFGRFGKYITTTEGVTSLGDIQTFNRFLSGDKDLTLVIKEVGDGLFVPLTGCTSTKTISGDIDLTSGGKYLSGGIDISSLFGASLPVLANGQTYVGVGGAGVVNSMYLMGGDVYLADTMGTLLISAGSVTTSHISAGAITDVLVSSEEGDRISGVKVKPNFGTQSVDTSGSYLLSGVDLLQTLDTKYLPLTGGTLTGSLTIEVSSTSGALNIKQQGEGSLIEASNDSTVMFVVLSSGNVGIKQTTPEEELDVNGTVKATQLKVIESGTTAVLYTTETNVGINTETPNEKLTVVGSISATDNVYATGLSAQTLSAEAVSVNSIDAINGNIQNFTTTNASITASTIVSSLLSATTITADEGIFSKFLATDFSDPTLMLSNSDSGHIYHLDTMSYDITAVFPPELNIGFNIGLMNTGTGTIYISSAQPGLINAFLGVNTNKTLNTGVFVYKHSNSQIYGVGMFNPL